MSKRSQLLASISRVDALLEAATAEAGQDLELIRLCRECVCVEAGGDLVFSAAADDSSKNQSINEELDRPLARRAVDLLDEVGKMRPTTKEGLEACAHVALGFASRGADDQIETNAIGEALAWKLIEQMVELPI